MQSKVRVSVVILNGLVNEAKPLLRERRPRRKFNGDYRGECAAPTVTKLRNIIRLIDKSFAQVFKLVDPAVA